MHIRFISTAFVAAILAASSALADITVNGTSYSSGVGLNTANGTFTITGTASGYINVKQNCTIVLDNVTWTASDKKQDLIKITAGLTVNLRLKGSSTIGNNSKNYVTGIYVCSGTTLNITNITEDASLTVSATGSYCTGIGGSYNGTGAAGTINIFGGTISSTGGAGGAGIGGYKAAGGTVSIYGGTVTAKGGGSSSDSMASAGIGGGSGGAGGTVNIYGGTVKATGGTYSATYGGAGIGGGNKAAGGTVNVYGGTVTATGGTRAACIGGCKEAAGGTVKVYGGCVTATGGERGAGIGGGTGKAGGIFHNYGGTVWAKGTPNNDGSCGDIGAGQSGSSGSPAFIVKGGSTVLVNGSRYGMAAPTDGSQSVCRVAVPGFSANERCSFNGLGEYGQDTLIANASGVIHLWLPNGTYIFSDKEWIYSATVSGAATTATRTAKPKASGIIISFH